MAEYTSLIDEEITATLDRAEFETLHPDAFRVEVTASFQRKLGECRPIQPSDDPSAVNQYEIRIARRLFEDGEDERWRDTVRHEVAHAYVLETVDREVQPHGDEWMAAARKAGADPVARYEGDDTVDAEYVLACPNGCFERGYLQRSTRIKTPWLYTCDACGTRPISYDITNRPADPEPGMCYVSSLPWQTQDDRDGQADGRSTARYLLACPNGCTVWPYQRRTKRIKNPWQYSCPECDATLLSCDGDGQPTDLDPGHCHVTSIPWREPRFIHACPTGCFSVGYGEQCDETRHPARYRCEHCGSKTIAYPANDRPADLEPGTSYIE
jgi:predicted SprT family Zn-dependent metalloprotease